MYIAFIYYIVIHLVPCEPNTTYEEQHPLIEQIKEKLDIYKIKTFYCQYTFFQEVFSGRFTGKTWIENKEIAWDNYFDKGNFLFASSQTVDVVKPDIDLVYTGEEQDINNERENEKINGSTEISLLSVIKSKLERNIHQPNTDLNKINFDALIPIGKCYTESKYCRYKGKELNVSFKYFDDGRTTVTKSTFLIDWQDFYILCAFLIVVLTPTGDNTFVKYISLGEFLDLPGPFHISKKDGYTILWHYSRAKMLSWDNSEYELPISVDIWIDNNLDIYRMDFVRYHSRTMDIEKFKEANWNDRIDCEYPYLLEKRIEFDNYQEFNDNIRIPLHITITEYKVDTDSEEGKELELDLKNGNISPTQHFLNSSRLPRKASIKEEYFLDPNSIKVNQELSEEIFQIPEISQNNVKSKIINHYPLVLFVGGCILIVIIAIFLTNKYLGWSI